MGDTGAAAGALDDTTQRVRSVLHRLVTVRPVGLDDGLGPLCDDPALAEAVLIAIEEELDATITMSDLMDARSARDLAELVLGAGGPAGFEASTVACVQPGAEAVRPRLWFVHDLRGSSYDLRRIARDLGEDQPVWGFDSPLRRGLPNPSPAWTRSPRGT